MTVFKQEAPERASRSSLGADFRTAGYGRPSPDMKRQMVAQLRKVPLSSRGLLSRPLARAVSALASYAPGPLDLSYVCNSGDEALDFGLKLSRGLTPERTFVAGLSGEDHGALVHGRSITAGRPLWPGQALLPRTVPSDRAPELLDLIDETVAAVVVSPVGPGRSLASLNEHWWHELRQKCWATGALLVGDERVSGPARLGHPYGFSAHGVTPDVMVLGSQLGAGLVPVGVAVTSYELYRQVFGHRNGTVHGSTFGANPMASTATAAVLESDRIKALTDWCAKRGELWSQSWSPMSENEFVASTSIDGLYASVTFTSRSATRAAKSLLEKQSLHPGCPAAGQTLTFAPPLTIDDNVFEDAIKIALEMIVGLDDTQIEEWRP